MANSEGTERLLGGMIEAIDSIKADQKQVLEKVNKHEVEIAIIKTKAMLLGSLFGAITSAIVSWVVKSIFG